MRRSGALLLVSAALATAALLAGYAWGPWGGRAPLLALLAVPWLLGRPPRLGWMPSLGFGLCVVAAALGAYLGAQPAWMLLAVILALAAWDLDGFGRRLQSAAAVQQQEQLERHHLGRLLPVVVVGGLFGALALGLRVELGLGAVLFIGMGAIAGISQALRFLRRASD